MAIITTPIYYVNDKPHIGHAYSNIAADVYNRYQKSLLGILTKGKPYREKYFFSTGTDEHGQKVQRAAQAAGRDTQDFVDDVSQSFVRMNEALNVVPDRFIRTTDEDHGENVKRIWNDLVEKDQIYLGSYGGWYAVKDEAFYTEKEIVDGKAPTGAPVEWVEEPSYFFRLSAWTDKLLKFLDDNPDYIQPKSRYNEVYRFIEGGLEDLSISRTSFNWGWQVPNDPDHVVYVWFDALPNYMTVAGDMWNKADYVSKDKVEVTHIIGKDILRFHAVYWTAMLMALEMEMPKRIIAHGWWTVDGEKMGKSNGNAIDPIEMAEKYGADTLRYYLLRETTFGNDGDFSEQRLVERTNQDLANDLGNMVHRCLTLYHKNFGDTFPEDITFQQDQQDQIYDILADIGQDFENLNYRAVLDGLNTAVSTLNRQFTEMEPWKYKDFTVDGNKEKMESILCTFIDCIAFVADVYSSIIPDSAAKILKLCGAWDNESIHGKKLPKPEIIFKKNEYLG